ncbi:MAG: kynureninase [Kiritimatiellia bacterium]|jgi:kynureninase
MSLRHIAVAQGDRALQAEDRTSTELQLLLHRAMQPSDVHKAILKERPVLESVGRLDFEGPDPATLRVEAMASGTLICAPEDMAFRDLFPALDVGVYCANHAVGKPSVASRMAVQQFLSQFEVFGVEGFMKAGWIELMEDARHLMGELCGDPGLVRGDVTWFGNTSDALSATLNSLSGRLVTTQGYFTTGHYVHGHWGQRDGNRVVTVPYDKAECVPAERVVAALTADTEVVSLSLVNWRSAHVHDMQAICAAMADVCPHAALVLNVTQSLGTIPVPADVLPPRTALVGTGMKQLRAGTGTGYAWFSHELLRDLRPDRTGWWAHEAPIDFDPGPMRWAAGAARLRTGTQALVPLVRLVTELKVLAASGEHGDVTSGVRRARRVTSELVAAARDRALLLGLRVRGPVSVARRAAFIAVEVNDGPGVYGALAAAGVVADFRSDEQGGSTGIIRVSASAAHFDYELEHVIDLIANAEGHLD